MPGPTVILDLSTLVRLDGNNDWGQVDLIVDAWREQRDKKARFYGVADNSLRYQMDPWGQEQLNEWKRRGTGRSVPWADPVILELAERHTGAAILTTDLYRDHRNTHPWLQGTDRVFRPVISGKDVRFDKMDFSPIPDHEVSWRIEEAGLTPKGVTTPEARDALRFEWSCTNPLCAWAAAPVIDEDPIYANQLVCCPSCRQPARKIGNREQTREIVILLNDTEADRIPVADGTSIIVGRGRGENRYDVRDLLADSDANLVSRDHVQLKNKSGRLMVEDLGSRNGTTLVRGDAVRADLVPGVVQVLDGSDRVGIANEVLQLRVSGRKRPRGRYAPDLSTPPWLGKASEEGT